MSFLESLRKFDAKDFYKASNNIDLNKIKSILMKDDITLYDLQLLLSKSAGKILQSVASKARDLTIKRFGKVINFYIPIYLSNECGNYCLYCGFNASKNIKRKTLSFDEIEGECQKIKKTGFDNVLLLTGEAPKKVGIDSIEKTVRIAKKYFTFVGLEIYPLDINGYSRLVKAGADGLTIYQETYSEEIYSKMHVKGKKKDYAWRLESPDRAAQAGFRKIGIGALLGLSDWRYEANMLALHLDYLQKKYWKIDFTLSFPRLKPLNDGFNVPNFVSDKNLVHMICALRIFLSDVGFVLSTRESSEIRDKLMELCITQMSAGSKTNPGGYTNDYADKQFDISDNRELLDMINVIKSKGYEPVLKDWEKTFLGVEEC